MEFKKQLKNIKKTIAYHRIHNGFKLKEEKRYNEPICICKDKNGEFKTLYITQKKAMDEAKEVWKSKGIKLKSYPCPDTLGWHLSRY